MLSPHPCGSRIKWRGLKVSDQALLRPGEPDAIDVEAGK